MSDEFVLQGKMHDGVEVYVQKVKLEGDVGEIVELRDKGDVMARYCSCGGVKRPCPEGYTAACRCSDRPPTLICIKI